MKVIKISSGIYKYKGYRMANAIRKDKEKTMEKEGKKNENEPK